jgi:hypothetical protein
MQIISLLAMISIRQGAKGKRRRSSKVIKALGKRAALKKHKENTCKGCRGPAESLRSQYK